MSRIMRKPGFHICVNKGTDQLRSNCEADLRLCFRYSVSTIPLLLNSQNLKPLAWFCDCTGRFVSHPVGNVQDWFSHTAAQITLFANGMNLIVLLHSSSIIQNGRHICCSWCRNFSRRTVWHINAMATLTSFGKVINSHYKSYHGD